MNKAVIIYSGGMDSFTLINQLAQGIYDVDKVYALSFDYGQRHKKELFFAAHVCDALGIEHKIIGMSEIGKQLLQGSSLTSDDMAVPEGHYAEPSMKQTVVPNRNMIMLALATGYAVSVGATEVYAAVHAGDHAIYPDCRPEFIATLNQVTKIANYQPVFIQAPYLFVDKRQILSMGLTLNLDYGKSWTCYNGRDKACGKCGSCTERLEAFKLNGANDPLPYETAFESQIAGV